MLNKNERLLCTVQKAILDRLEKNFEMEAKTMKLISEEKGELRKKVVAYVRGEEKQIEIQKREIYEYAKRNGFELVKFYEDDNSKDKPQLEKLIENVDGVEAIIVCKLDRIARNMEKFMKIDKLLEEKNIELVALDFPLENDVNGRLFKQLLVTINERLSQNIKEEIKNNLAKRNISTK